MGAWQGERGGTRGKEKEEGRVNKEEEEEKKQ